MRALIKPLTGVGRHLFGFDVLTLGACQHRFQSGCAHTFFLNGRLLLLVNVVFQRTKTCV